MQRKQSHCFFIIIIFLLWGGVGGRNPVMLDLILKNNYDNYFNFFGVFFINN